MVLKTIHECDKCGQRCEFDSFHVVVDRKMDAAGSMDDIWESFDWCYSCCQRFIREYVKKLTFSESRAFVQSAKEKPKPIRV